MDRLKTQDSSLPLSERDFAVIRALIWKMSGAFVISRTV
jgi:hypothetical protein